MNGLPLLERLRPSLRFTVALLLALALLASMAAAPAAAQTTQTSEQESDSGDVDQSGTTSLTGDNSNQCVNEQLVANTGNAQNQIDVVVYGTPADHEYGERGWFFFFDDLEFDDVGSTIEVSPESSTECTQTVDQAATATSSSPWYWDGYVWWYYDGATWCYLNPAGYCVSPYGASLYPVSNVASGALDAAGGTMPLAILGSVALLGTAGLVWRRNRGRS